jgi:hypothetical protein
MTVSAHFDGRVFVPDGPVDLPVGRRVRVVPEPADGPKPDGMPPEVRDFCAAHGLAGPVAELVRLAREEMPGLTDAVVRLQSDPESEESWVVVEARLAGGPSKVLAEYKAVIRRWIDITEPRARDLVRFTFSLS